MNRYFLSLLVCAPLFATVNVRDYGAAGNGVNNDTTAVTRAFAQGCSTSDTVYLPTGTYLVDVLPLLSGCGATFYGDGIGKSTLRFRSGLTGGFQSYWTFGNGAGKTLQIHDLSVDGGHATLAGLTIDSYSSVSIQRISSANFGTPGYAAGHRGSLDGLYIRNTDHASIDASSFTGNERMGVELQAVHHSIISNSTMSGNGRLGGVSEQNFAGPLDGPLDAQWTNNTMATNGSGCIDVETDPSLPGAHGIMTGNTCADSGNDNWDSGWAFVLGEHAYGTISNNKVTNFSAKPTAATIATGYDAALVAADNAGSVVISNNTVTGSRGRPIRVYYATGATITANDLEANPAGMDLVGDPNITVQCNIVKNSPVYGVALESSHPYTVLNNGLTGNNPNLRIDGATVTPTGNTSACGTIGYTAAATAPTPAPTSTPTPTSTCPSQP